MDNELRIEFRYTCQSRQPLTRSSMSNRQTKHSAKLLTCDLLSSHSIIVLRSDIHRSIEMQISFALTISLNPFLFKIIIQDHQTSPRTICGQIHRGLRNLLLLLQPVVKRPVGAKREGGKVIGERVRRYYGKGLREWRLSAVGLARHTETLFVPNSCALPSSAV
jgi:hypothetical protein